MKEQDVYIGNCSKNGIYCYNLKNGRLIKKYVTNDFERCTYLASSKSYLYGVIEIQSTKGYIVSYKKEQDKLINTDKKTSYGQGPCHIETNEELQLAFVSNYVDGYFVVFELNEDGTIGNKIYSSVQDIQKSHVHCAKTSIDNKFLFMIDLGKDAIIAYEIKKDAIEEISKMKFKQNTQPRHMVVNKDKIYVVTEKSCEIYTLKFENKQLTTIDKALILSENVDIKENYTGCAIKASKDNKYIYVSIRGNNSISVYKTNKDKLKMIQNISCKGDLPRDLEIDKSGKYVLVANQASNEISIFKRNRLTGKLKYKNKEKMDSPTCVIIK